MRRALLCVTGLAVAAVVALTWPAPGPRAEEGKNEPLSARLTSRVSFPALENPTTLQDALDALADRFGLTFEVNEAAFKAEMVEDVRSAAVADRPFPKMTNVRLDTVLRKILARVPAASGATYLLRADGIEITTGARLAQEVWGRDYNGPFLPLANATFEKRPLEDALKELAEAADFSILVDAKAAEKARTPVTARLANVPLDTGVRLLANMADLQSFLVDNVLYVTTKEGAAALAKQEKQRLEENEASGPRIGGSGRPVPIAQPAGM
jgi:hypothetical protein